jgi:hypothetical protein
VSLELEVEDGDDRPLTLRDARAEIATRTVFFAAPDGSYRVLVGHPEAEAPRYELEDAIDLVLAVRSPVAELGAVRDNPAHEPPAFWKRVDVTSFLVWGVLIFAVLVLGVVTLRLARSGAEPEPEPSGGSATGATSGASVVESEPTPRGEAATGATSGASEAESSGAADSEPSGGTAASAASTDVESPTTTSSTDTTP